MPIGWRANYPTAKPASVIQANSYAEEIMDQFPVNSVILYKGARSAVYGHCYTDTGLKIKTVDAKGRLDLISPDGGFATWWLVLTIGGLVISFAPPFGFLIGIPLLFIGLLLTPFGLEKPKPEQPQKEPGAARSLLSLLATLTIIGLVGYVLLLIGRV
jgi:hypothetical protein